MFANTICIKIATFSGLTMVSNLAIDYSTGNLYYTAEGPTKFESYIGVVHRTTFAHKTLISNIFKPNDIALYSSKGCVQI